MSSPGDLVPFSQDTATSEQEKRESTIIQQANLLLFHTTCKLTAATPVQVSGAYTSKIGGRLCCSLADQTARH